MRIRTNITEKTFKCSRCITTHRRFYKMRKSVIVGSLLAVFLMVMVPAVSAAESTIAQSATSSPLLKAQEAYLEALISQYADGPQPATILLTLAILFLKLLRWGVIIIDLTILLIIIRILRGGQNNTTGVIG
jgi:hypothetical protein